MGGWTKLYARKVLIQEYNRDLLPEYFSFVQGVVDSEDLPLNVSRETVQSSRAMAQIKKLLTARVIETLKKLAEEDKEKYQRFWEGYARYIKQGVAIEQNQPEELYPLLRFKTITQPGSWVSLDEVVQDMKADQKEIFYIMGDDERSVLYSLHLDVIQHCDYSAILLTGRGRPVLRYGLNIVQVEQCGLADLKLPELIRERLAGGWEAAGSTWSSASKQLGESSDGPTMTSILTPWSLKALDRRERALPMPSGFRQKKVLGEPHHPFNAPE
jgi:molecular chaperone HtpG